MQLCPEWDPWHASRPFHHWSIEICVTKAANPSINYTNLNIWHPSLLLPLLITLNPPRNGVSQSKILVLDEYKCFHLLLSTPPLWPDSILNTTIHLSSPKPSYLIFVQKIPAKDPFLTNNPTQEMWQGTRECEWRNIKHNIARFATTPALTPHQPKQQNISLQNVKVN